MHKYLVITLTLALGGVGLTQRTHVNELFNDHAPGTAAYAYPKASPAPAADATWAACQADADCAASAWARQVCAEVFTVAGSAQPAACP